MKILIADGHQLLADALAQLLRENEAGTQVVHASSLDDAIKAMDRDGPVELVLLDYDLPGMNGVSGLDRFRGKYPGTPCAVSCGVGDTLIASDVLAHGADGFIPKDMSAHGFFHALKLIQVGERFIPGQLYEQIANQTEAARQRVQSADDFIREAGLTRREAEVLRSLAQGNSNREIGEALGIEEVTIKLHLRRVYRKLGVSSRTQAVKLAVQVGLG